MTYVYLNYNEMKSIVGELTDYADVIEQTKAEIQRTREDNNGAGDTSGMANWGELIASLRDNSTEINDRIETAKKLNENGLSPMKGELISYIVPDDMEDKKDTVVMHAKGVMEATELSRTIDEGKAPSEESWNELISRIRKNKGNPVYADAFVSTIGPKKMLDLPYQAMEMFGSINPRHEEHYRKPESMHDLNKTFAHLLSTASQKWGTKKSTAFANQLADAAEKNPRRMINLRVLFMWGLPACSVEFEFGDQGDDAGELCQAVAVAGG